MEREKLAVSLWKTGVLKQSEGALPLYFDREAALQSPLAGEILDGLTGMIREHYASADCLLGDVWAEPLSVRLGLPLGLHPGARCPLIVTDVVTDGAAQHSLALPIREGGASVAIAAVFSYGLEEARRRLDKADVRLHWLTDLETASAVGLQEGFLDFDEYERLMAEL